MADPPPPPYHHLARGAPTGQDVRARDRDRDSVEDAGSRASSSSSSSLSTSSTTLEDEDDDDDAALASMRRDHLSSPVPTPRRALSQSLSLSFNFDFLAGEGLRRSVLVRNALLASSMETLPPKHAEHVQHEEVEPPSTVTCGDYYYQDEEEEVGMQAQASPRPYTEAEWFDDLLQELEDGIAGRDGEEAQQGEVKHSALPAQRLDIWSSPSSSKQQPQTPPLRIASKEAREVIEEQQAKEEHHVAVCDSADGYTLVWCDDEDEEHVDGSEPLSPTDLCSSEGLPALVPDSDEDEDEEDPDCHGHLGESCSFELSDDDDDDDDSDDNLATPEASNTGPFDFSMRLPTAEQHDGDESCCSSSTSSPRLRSTSSGGSSEESEQDHHDDGRHRRLTEQPWHRSHWQPTLALPTSTDYWQRLMTGSASDAASAAFTLSCRPLDEGDHDYDHAGAIVQSWQRPRSGAPGLSLHYHGAA